MKTNRKAPGYYEVETEAGTAKINRIAPNQWYVTYPRQDFADDCYATLGEAKLELAYWIDGDTK